MSTYIYPKSIEIPNDIIMSINFRYETINFETMKNHLEIEYTNVKNPILLSNSCLLCFTEEESDLIHEINVPVDFYMIEGDNKHPAFQKGDTIIKISKHVIYRFVVI